MKTKKKTSLKLVKASIAILENAEATQIQGGRTRIADCNSFNSMCITSCHVH